MAAPIESPFFKIPQKRLHVAQVTGHTGCCYSHHHTYYYFSMIVLPNTPEPKPVAAQLPPECLALRANVLSSQSDPARFVASATDYLEAIFASVHVPGHELADAAEKANTTVISPAIPWTGFKKLKTQWSLAYELHTVALAICFAYIRLGAELTNELIDLDPAAESAQEVAEKWKAATRFYTKASSFALFGQQLPHGLDPRVFLLVDKVALISTQMTLLSKYSAMNRSSYNSSESFASNNNGVLCRVAIYVTEETQAAINMVDELASLNGISLLCSGWPSYLALVKRYGSAYAGLFYLIEHYKKNSLGHAIGLVNYALLCLQSKRSTEQPKKKRIFSISSKIAAKRNDAYVSSLQSTTSLNIDKSNFQLLSGIVLKDVALLFDQLVQCHLKYTKENDNLQFDSVSDWKDVHGDSRWPFGSKIPQEPIAPFVPRVLQLT